MTLFPFYSPSPVTMDYKYYYCTNKCQVWINTAIYIITKVFFTELVLFSCIKIYVEMVENNLMKKQPL